MDKKFEINWIKIKGGCQSGRKMVTHNSKSDLPLSAPRAANPTLLLKAHVYIRLIFSIFKTTFSEIDQSILCIEPRAA